MDILNSKITFMDSIKGNSTEDITLQMFLSSVANGIYEDKVNLVRTHKENNDKEKAKYAKEGMPAVVVSGLFQGGRNEKNFVKDSYTGLIIVDIDGLQSPEDIKALFVGDAYCISAFVSVGGKGLAVLFRVNCTYDRHKEAFEACCNHVALTAGEAIGNQGGKIDIQVKDVARCRFLSSDKDIYLNAEAEALQLASPAPSLDNQRPQRTRHAAGLDNEKRLIYMLEQSQKEGLSVALEDYEDWVKIGFALATEFGENGRAYFHALSEGSSKYSSSDCDKKFDELRRTNKGEYTFASVVDWFKSKGLKDKHIPKPRHEGIGIDDKKANMYYCVINLMPYKIAADYLLHKKLIEREDRKTLRAIYDLEKLPKMSMLSAFNISVNIEDIIAYELNKKGLLRYNLIREEVEFLENGNYRQLTDIDLINIRFIIGRSFPMLWDKIKSYEKIIEAVAKENSYNPVALFIDSKKSLYDSLQKQPEANLYANVDRLFFSLFANDNISTQEDIVMAVYIGRYWYINFVAMSLKGHKNIKGVSELMLWIVGGQGTGKTTFFNSLIPEALGKKYIHVLRHANDKDEEISIAKSLICIDEEAAKNNRITVEYSKRLLSQQFFSNVRQPYGRIYRDYLRRNAFCGTSNTFNVLKDVTGNRRLGIIEMKAKRDFNALTEDVIEAAFISAAVLIDEAIKAQGCYTIRIPEAVEEMIVGQDAEEHRYTAFDEESEGLLAVFQPVGDKDKRLLLKSSEIVQLLKTLKIKYYNIGETLRRLGFEKVNQGNVVYVNAEFGRERLIMLWPTAYLEELSLKEFDRYGRAITEIEIGLRRNAAVKDKF